MSTSYRCLGKSPDSSASEGQYSYIFHKPEGAAIGDAEFFSMVLRVWLGPVPADYKLKDALLGQ